MSAQESAYGYALRLYPDCRHGYEKTALLGLAWAARVTGPVIDHAGGD
jgi:hypothetical protein